MNLLEIKNMLLRRPGEGKYELHIGHLEVGPGEHIAIVGPSGCGKSTTLDLAGMILRPDECGEFSLNFEDASYDIADLWNRGKINQLTDLRRKHYGYVLQTGELFGFLTVRENIELAALASGRAPQDAGTLAGELMEKLDIRHLENKKPGKLSIGERQRTAIARAMAPRPQILLADEPTAALDPNLARKVMRLFLDAAESYGASIVMVTHDLNLAREFEFREAPIATKTTDNGIVAILDDGND